MQTEHRDHTHGKQSHEKRSLMFRVCPNLTSVQSKKESACKATLMLSAKKLCEVQTITTFSYWNGDVACQRFSQHKDLKRCQR